MSDPRPSRRSFLQMAAATGGALSLGLGGRLPEAFGAPAVHTRPGRAPLKILILGGTSFIGPYQVQYALDRGHTVTLFNRGRTNPGLFPTVEKLIGDRTGDVSALQGRSWDVVIDNSATDPTWVTRTAQLLAPTCKRYYFVSTRSVYYDVSRVPMTIGAQVFTRENTPVAEGRALPYGLSKALAEAEAQKYFPGRSLVVRPGLIVGPGDNTDRFTYWPVRIERGGDVMAPGDGTDPVQVIDARDLGEWMIKLAEQDAVGVYNAVGPRNPRSFAEFLYGIKAVTTSEAQFTWVPTEFLTANRVRSYQEMPVWRPATKGSEGFARFDLSREIALGLTFRPLAVTAKDTLDFYHSRPAAEQATLRAGITPEREVEVLALWKKSKG